MNAPGPRRKFRRLALWIFVGFLGLAALLVLIDLLSGPGYTPPPLPHPNGYDDFLLAGKMMDKLMVRGKPVYELDETDAGELRKAVDRRAGALRFARQGLSRECRIPDATREDFLGELGTLGNVCDAFLADGLLARFEGRFHDALRSYCDLVLLGVKRDRGGVSLDCLHSIGFQITGIASIHEILEMLTAGDCRNAITIILRCRKQRTPLNEIIAADRAYNRRKYSLFTRIKFWLKSPAPEGLLRKSSLRMDLHYQMLLARLGLRAYSLEHGRYPAALQELVPELLDSLPLDPWTGKALIYRPGDDSGRYILYSAGSDGNDGGGLGDDISVEALLKPKWPRGKK